MKKLNRLQNHGCYIHIGLDEILDSFRIYMENDGTWIIHEFCGTDWQASFIGASEHDPWRK